MKNKQVDDRIKLEPNEKFEMTRREIAEELGLSDGQVKRALSTAIQKIKESHPELAEFL